jgi:hypothetical protein
MNKLIDLKNKFNIIEDLLMILILKIIIKLLTKTIIYRTN